MSYQATLRLAAAQLLRLADDVDAAYVVHELGEMLNAGQGGTLKAALLRARGEAIEAVVAEEGSQRQAAQRLGIAQPTLSRAIARIPA